MTDASGSRRSDSDPEPFERVVLACSDGASIVLRRLHRPGRPRLFLSHGNGFAIGGYRVFWSLLAQHFELVLFDLRNHGENPLHDIDAHTVAAMARDHLEARALADDAFGPRSTIGVFHSISSIAAIVAARDHALAWDALALIDPPLRAPPGHDMSEQGGGLDVTLAQFARGRPERFEDPVILAAQFSVRVGRNWAPGAAMDMARAVTRPAADGGYELSCPGEYEARIYEQNARVESFAALSALRQPTFIIGADPQAPRAQAPARIGPVAAAAHGLPHEAIAGTSHMLQIEKPAEAAAVLRRRLAALGFG